MIRQYPYTLQVIIQVPDTQDPNTGSIIPGSSSWIDVCKCRDEAGSGKRVTLSDGNVYEYQFLVQCPRGIEALIPGSKIRIIDSAENVRCQGSVSYSRKDQLHTRIWV